MKGRVLLSYRRDGRMAVVHRLFAGVLVYIAAFIPGWVPSTAGAASQGLDRADALILEEYPGRSPSAWGEFWCPRELSVCSINSLESPALCGRSFARLLCMAAAMIFVTGAAFYLKAAPVGRLRIVTGMGTAVLILWLIYDFRETYGQFRIMEAIYRCYVKPPPADKTFSDMGNFYSFVDLCRKVIPPDAQFHFYSEPDWPYDCRMHYFLYPRRMASHTYGSNTLDTKAVPYYVVYDDPHIRYDPVGRRLHYDRPDGTRLVSKAGAIVAEFGRNSFIFLKGEAVP